MWSVLGAFVGIFVVVTGLALLRRYRTSSPSAKAGFTPHNVSPWMRLWRQRRADQGKGDNWFTRPLVRLDGGRVDLLPPREAPLKPEQ
jgi:hypothetical protein